MRAGISSGDTFSIRAASRQDGALVQVTADVDLATCSLSHQPAAPLPASCFFRLRISLVSSRNGPRHFRRRATERLGRGGQ